MRNGFDGLAGIVRNFLKHDPIGGSVFIFLNRTGTHINLLYWDGDGFALFYKRLERGRYSLAAQSKKPVQLRRAPLVKPLSIVAIAGTAYKTI